MTFRQKPRAHAGILAAVIHIAEEAGMDAAELLRRAGINPDIRDEPNAIVHIEKIHDFFRAISKECGDAFFLWNAVLEADPADFGFYGQLAVNTRILGDAFSAIADNIRHLVSNSVVDIEEDGSHVRICYRLHDEGTRNCRQESEIVAAFAIGIVRYAHGRRWMPKKVYFEHEQPADAENYGDAFISLLEFECGGSGILVSKDDLDAEMPDRDVYLEAAVGHFVENVVGKTITYGENALLLRREIAPRLPNGTPVLQDLATEFGMSPRTMQRRLSEEGTSYSDVLEDLRKDMSERLLANRGLTITEVAYLLGYADLSSFDRAYRKWTGRTPIDDRRRLAGKQAMVTG